MKIQGVTMPTNPIRVLRDQEEKTIVLKIKKEHFFVCCSNPNCGFNERFEYFPEEREKTVIEVRKLHGSMYSDCQGKVEFDFDCK